MFKGCIYCSESPSGKKYYGQTINFKRRILEHKRDSIESVNSRFYGAIKKYGYENFNWEIIEFCENDTKEGLKKLLNEREKFHIFENKTTNENFGYNISDGGDGGYSILNHPNLENIKKKISEKNKGKKRSDETKKKIADANRNKILSQETKKKISDGNKGKKRSIEDREKQGKSITGEKNHFYGKHHSKETKDKLSKSLSGSNHPQYGKNQSFETIEKKKRSLTGKKHKRIICEHCQKEVDDRNYHRWHGNNCKQKK